MYLGTSLLIPESHTSFLHDEILVDMDEWTKDAQTDGRTGQPAEFNRRKLPQTEFTQRCALQ